MANKILLYILLLSIVVAVSLESESEESEIQSVKQANTTINANAEEIQQHHEPRVYDTLDALLKIYDAEPSERGWRLPNTTKPLKYHLHITTNVHREILDYYGNCTIEILVEENTNELVLHAKNLNIQHISIMDLTEKVIMTNITFTLYAGFLIINSSNITAGDNETASDESTTTFRRNRLLSVEILYVAAINSRNMGFHKLSYETADNKTIFGTKTQFEPIFARTALPCYDEPSFKATFNLRITHGNNFSVIANMPQLGESIEGDNNMTTTTFMETPVMSTYLLAFIISNYVHTSMESDGIQQRLFLPPTVKSNAATQIALDNSIKMLKIFGELMEIPYGLPKLDHIVVREAFGLAMENWGLITYAEKLLIHEGQNGIGKSLYWILSQTHELIHQWFGNLVSPKWWSYIWLNEGFANYYNYILAHKIYPDQNVMDIFILDVCYRSFEPDQNAMSEYIDAPQELHRSFGAIGYRKAPCVLQMFEYMLQDGIFHTAIKQYLKEFSYSAVTEDDLFNVVERTVKEHYKKENQTWNYNLINVMKTWTQNKQYPIVNITRNYTDNTLLIKQHSAHEDSEDLWWIPLNFVSASEPSFENTTATFFMPPIKELKVNLQTLGIQLKREDWFMVNKRAKYYYHVIYDHENMVRISSALRENHHVIDRHNRAGLFKAITECIANDVNIDLKLMFEQSSYLIKEDDAVVWSAAIETFNYLFELLDRFVDLQPLYNHFQRLMKPFYTNFTTKAETKLNSIEEYTAEAINDFACLLSMEECLQKNKEIVLRYISDSSYRMEHNYPNILAMICSAVEIFNDTEFENALSTLLQRPDGFLWHYLRCTNLQRYEKLFHAAINIKETNADVCDSKMTFLSDVSALKSTEMNNLTWTLLQKNLYDILHSKNCDPDIFYENLVENMKIVKTQFIPEYSKIINRCEEHRSAMGLHITPAIASLGTEYGLMLSEELRKQNIIEWLQNDNEINAYDLE